ncbi:MAG: hypothetical protein ACI4PQ_07080 [Butyricicoccaceae bacterium]
MNLIFIGLIFVLLDFNIPFIEPTINCLPDWLGYLLLAAALRRMAEKSICFRKVRPFIRVAILYTGLLFVLNLFGLSERLGDLSLFPELVASLLALYITYLLGLGLNDLESAQFCVLRAYAVYEAWRWLMLSWVGTYTYQILITFPPHLPRVFLSVFIVITLMCTAYYLFRFGQARGRYYRFIR